MKENSELRALARASLRGGWLAAVGMLIIYSLILSAAGISVAGAFVIGGPLLVGFLGYYVKKARGEAVKLENLFDGFSVFGSAFLLYLLEAIFLTLWTCLFIIPGIVKWFSYSMAFFILRDNPEIGAAQAITQSRKMMNGRKGKLLCLYLSFIGWALLSCLSLGIGFLWLCPYISASLAHFYEDLKENAAISITEGSRE